MTDEELVARAQAGSEDAWTELVARHHAAVFRTAHAALLSSPDADDAAQDAWVAAWRHLGEFRGHASFRTWLLTVAWRKALDRRHGVSGWMRMLRLGAARDEDDGPDLELAGTGSDAERALLDDEARRRLKRLVKGLPRAHRDALLLVATRDLPYTDAAALLGIAVGTLKWRVSDARRLLRERLGRSAPGKS